MLTSLEIFDVRGCLCLESFLEVLGKMEEIREIYLDKTSIEKLPFSIRNFIGIVLLSLTQCRNLNQLPGSICTLTKVEVILDYEHEPTRYRFFKKNQYEEELSSELSPNAMLVCHNPRFTYLDMHYPYISPNNIIQLCSPSPLMHSDFDFLFQKFARLKDWFR